MSRARGLVATVMALALLAVAGWAGPASAAVAPRATGTRVLRPSRASAAQLVAWFNLRSPGGYRATVPLATLVNNFVDEGNAQGVAWDLAFAQSVVETGWFTFPSTGQVKPADNNFSGLGAVDNGGGASVAKFATAQLGVRAQMQHLWAYADPAATAAGTARPLVDPRFDLVKPKGKAPTWEQFGNGIWASDPVYATTILSRYQDLLTVSGVQLARWVNKAYVDLIGRPADPGGQSYWVGQLKVIPRDVVAGRIAREPEALGLAIDRLYRTLLGRPLDLAGWSWWTGRLGAGTPYADLVVALMASGEFSVKAGGTDGGWVGAAYQLLLGRPADAGGLAFWTAALANHSWSRASLARMFWGTTEARQHAAESVFTIVLGRTIQGAGLNWAVAILASADPIALSAQVEATDESFAQAQA